MRCTDITEAKVRFANRNSLRQYIVQAIQDYLDEEDDLERLARILRMTVGRTVDIEGDQFAVEDTDITAALQEWKASKELCTSGKPNSAIGASALASCKSQGYRAREGGKSHKIARDRVKVQGKKLKGKQYGGDLPDWS